MQKRIKILDVWINNVSMEDTVNITETFIAEKKPHLIVTANAEIVMLAGKDPDFAKILAEAALVVPDGAGVVWAAKYYGHNMQERVTGYDLTQRLLALSAKIGYKVYMFGGAPGIVEEAADTAGQTYPGINIIGIHDGFLNSETEAKIIADIKAKRPDILLVALGVPKQEKWIARNAGKLNVPIAIGVGGSFDIMAGRLKRAPLWMQQSGLEWLYRLVSQPWRLIRMLALPRFVIKVITTKNS